MFSCLAFALTACWSFAINWILHLICCFVLYSSTYSLTEPKLPFLTREEENDNTKLLHILKLN